MRGSGALGDVRVVSVMSGNQSGFADELKRCWISFDLTPTCDPERDQHPRLHLEKWQAVC